MKRAPAIAAAIAAILFAGCSLVTDLNGFSTGDGGSDVSPIDGATLGDAPSDGALPRADAEAGADDECNENGLVAFWRMDVGSGPIAKDCTANLLHATTLAGTLMWAPGHRGRSIDLDGTTCLEVGLAEKLKFTTDFTVALWVLPNAFQTDGSVDYIIGRRGYDAPNGWRVGLRNDRPTFEIGAPDANLEILGAPRTRGEWSHLAVTFTGAKMRLYVEGQPIGALGAGVPASVISNDNSVRIGCVGGSPVGRFLRGRLDDVRAYSRALGDAEVLKLYTEGR